MEPSSIMLLAAGGGQAVAFYACAALAIAASLLMVIQKNPVASVLWLVAAFLRFPVPAYHREAMRLDGEGIVVG